MINHDDLLKWIIVCIEIKLSDWINSDSHIIVCLFGNLFKNTCISGILNHLTLKLLRCTLKNPEMILDVDRLTVTMPSSISVKAKEVRMCLKYNIGVQITSFLISFLSQFEEINISININNIQIHLIKKLHSTS